MGPMSPGGHLVTTAIAGGAVLASTGSIPLTAGLSGGGGLRHVDHVGDYVPLEGRLRRPPRPLPPFFTRRGVEIGRAAAGLRMTCRPGTYRPQSCPEPWK